MLSQLVVRPSPDGQTGLRLDTVNAIDRLSAESGRKLHLGSQDLIRLAAFATKQDFRVDSFQLADAYLYPLDTQDQDDISQSMVQVLRKYGEGELIEALRDEYDGIYVIGVKLVNVTTGMRMSVRRRGFVETSRESDAVRLLDTAWRELHLS